MTIDALDVARRFAAASAVGDEAGLRALYAPDFVAWHNTDLVEQTVDQNMKVSRWLFRTVPDIAFENVRQLPTPEGFVQTHKIVGTRPDGSRIEMWSAMVITVNGDGLISRLEEFIDPSKMGKLS